MTDPIFAVGDIHGHLDQLELALDIIARDADAGPIVFVGDYVDRGPDARGVIERLKTGQARGRNWICLQGNHDAMFVDFVRRTEQGTRAERLRDRYLSDNLGGRTTLASYGLDVDPRRADRALRAEAAQVIPADHLDWLASLPRYHETDAHVFVHAGIRPGVPLPEQDPDDLIWIRDDFLYETADHGKLVVHGHTPQKMARHHGNRVNIDGGTGFGRPLYPVLLRGREAYLLSGFGRAQL